jgi:hypothetical protein
MLLQPLFDPFPATEMGRFRPFSGPGNELMSGDRCSRHYEIARKFINCNRYEMSTARES